VFTVREEHFIYGDWGRHPETIEELMARSAVVIEGTVARFRPYDVLRVIEGASETRLFTAVAIEDVTWIKPAAAPRVTQVEVLLRTTERDRGDRIVRQRFREEPAPEVGQHYVLFLNPGPEDGLYGFSRGRESAFLIQGDIIIPAGESALSKRLAGMRRADLVSLLRARAGA
jgi:hypothetical protein